MPTAGTASPPAPSALQAELIAADVPHPYSGGYEDLARSICGALDSGATQDDLSALFVEMVLGSGIPTPLAADELAAIAEAAIDVYCPEHVVRVFDAAALGRGVRAVLTDDYGLVVDSVTCPANTRVEQGASFQCDVTIGGQPRQVTLTITDDVGAYTVSRPG